MTASVSFNEAATFYDETRGGLTRGGNFVTAIDPFLPRGAQIVEVGVGTGLIALPLTEHGHVVRGFDIALAMLERAHERIGARVGLADASRLPVASGSCDAVVVVWVLHVVGDREAMIAECARVLRPGGRLVVVPADAVEMADDMAPISAAMRVANGRDRDTPERVAALATAVGLRLVHQGITDVYEYDESPEESAQRLERREWSTCWNLDDEQWAVRVQPFIDLLRALPEPERQRARRKEHPLLVFEKAS